MSESQDGRALGRTPAAGGRKHVALRVYFRKPKSTLCEFIAPVCEVVVSSGFPGSESVAEQNNTWVVCISKIGQGTARVPLVTI